MKPHHTRYQHEQFCITNCFWGSQGKRPPSRGGIAFTTRRNSPLRTPLRSDYAGWRSPSLTEINVDTPGSSIVTPNNESAIAIVRLLCVMTMN